VPPLAVHTQIAKGIADSLQTPALESQRGSLYLGATAPDVRVLTRWERERTHFFDIHNFGEQCSVDTFFASNPDLAEAGCLSESTRAFTAGYLSHLVADEMWIGAVYRPFFGERSELGGSVRANVMDRALQFSMDADVRSDTELMTHVLAAVTGCDLDLEIGFLDRDTLCEWQRVITEFVQSRPDWERFRSRAGKHPAASGQAPSDADFEELARSLPDLVDETLRYLSRERVDQVLRDSLDESVRVVKVYLGCA
jgi:hypothetical protein